MQREQYDVPEQDDEPSAWELEQAPRRRRGYRTWMSDADREEAEALA